MHGKDFSDHLLVILDAFVEESKLSFLEKEARNDHKHSQKERVNATKTEQRALRGSHWNKKAVITTMSQQIKIRHSVQEITVF